MQRDWNDRAREDANFYVAFGRRDQAADEFFDTARDVVRALERELRWLPSRANRRAWRALEIGCGPGRLMKPLAAHFGEIHGVDVSDEMIRRAVENLKGVPQAHAHHTNGSDLAPFADESFQFVYSYAVFQHIPSRDVVMQYLREAVRVLRTGGILRAQINGLDASAGHYDTWSGVHISAEEVREFAREHQMQLLALEGVRTQYMWTTMRKRTPGWNSSRRLAHATIRRVTNAQNSEPAIPQSGRFAAIAALVDGLPTDCDLQTLSAEIDGQPAAPCYIGPPDADGLQQVSMIMSSVERTGLVPLRLLWRGEPLGAPRHIRVIPRPPQVPAVVSVTDGINLLLRTRIMTGVVKVTVEEVEAPEQFSATVSGIPVSGLDVFCVDPATPRLEINFALPQAIGPGNHVLAMRLGRRSLGTVTLEVVR